MAQLSKTDAYRHIRPAAPTRPLISGIERQVGGVPTVSSILDLPYLAWFANGRSAIAQAAILAGVSPDSSVLVPAYHCESMIAPLAWLGPRVIPYRVREDFSIDLDHLMSVSDGRTRLVLVPQYFGHWKSTADLYRLAQDSNWSLVEDCAHAFFAICEPSALGMHSHFMVASVPKFVAAFDGGVLASRLPRPDWPSSRRPSLGAELRALGEAVEYAFDYGRWPRAARSIRPMLESIRRIIKGPRRETAGGVSNPASRYGGVEFEAAHVNTGATVLAKSLARRAKRAAIAAARRSNWEELRERIGVSRRVRFPIARLGSMDVPYVLALEIEDPERTFPALKARGIPVYRWETSFPGCDKAVCEVSERYRSSLIQLPCHQSLNSSELEWIARTVIEIVEHRAA